VLEKKSSKKKRKRISSNASESDSEYDEDDDNNDETPADSTRLLDFQLKHRTARSKWTVPESFPDAQIAAAYLQPKANYSADKFDWAVPNIAAVRAYCKGVLGWSESQVT